MVKLYTVPLCTPITHVSSRMQTHTYAATVPHQVTHSVSPLSFPLTYIFVFLSSPSIPTFEARALSPNSPERLRARSHSTSSSCDRIHPLPYLHSTVTLSWSHCYIQVKGPLEGVRTEHCGWQQNRPHLIPSKYSTAACTGHRQIK